MYVRTYALYILEIKKYILNLKRGVGIEIKSK